MKNSPTLLKSVSIATVGVALLFSAACSKNREADTVGSAANSTSAANGGATTTTAGTSTGLDSWDTLKGYSYEQRSEFATKATEYANRLEAGLTNAKGTASSRITEARDELRTAASEVSHATADTWDAVKDRVGRAWQKADSAIQSAAE